MMKIDALVLSCEHGGNRVPSRYAPLFRDRRARAALASHRGYDLGALEIARALQRRFGAPLIYSTVTRLLVELNRSPHHPQLFSEHARTLSDAEREHVLGHYYHPHRARVRAELERQLRGRKRILHVAVHSFTPRLGRKERTADVALLYDPRRRYELRWCARWKATLAELEPGLRVRRNYPYRGAADGLTTQLRRSFDDSRYLGIELETNQRLLLDSRASRNRVTRVIGDSLARLLQS